MLKIRKIINNNLFKRGFFLTCWLSIILSINVKLSDLNSIEIFNFTNIFNIIRYFFIKLIFFILLFLFFFKNFKIKINKFYFLLLVFSLVLVLSYILNCFFYTESLSGPYNIFDFDAYSLSISFISTILFFILIGNESKIFSLKLFYILYFIIAAYTTSILIPILYNFIFIDQDILYLYGQINFIADEYNFFNHTNQRVTGISRMLVILFCFLLFYMSDFLKNKKIIVNKRAYILIILLTLLFLTFCIWGFQSRGAFICYSVAFLMFLVFENLNLRLKIFTIIVIFILPIFLFEVISYTKYLKSIEKNGTIKNDITIKDDINKRQNRIIGITLDNTQDISTGRLVIWKRSIEKFKNKIILGYGESGDRRSLIYNKEHISVKEKHLWDSNASNAFIYSLLSGGIVGTLFFLFFFALLGIYIFKLIFIKKIFAKYSFEYKFFLVTILLLMVRTLYENGFSQFGIDFLMVLVATHNLLKIYPIK
jgi:O-antigen ligase